MDLLQGLVVFRFRLTDLKGGHALRAPVAGRLYECFWGEVQTDPNQTLTVL